MATLGASEDPAGLRWVGYGFLSLVGLAALGTVGMIAWKWYEQRRYMKSMAGAPVKILRG